MADRTRVPSRPRRSRHLRLAATARGALRRLFRIDRAEPPPVLADRGTAIGMLLAAARSTVARGRLARAEAAVEAAHSTLAFERSVWDLMPDLEGEGPADPLFRALRRQAGALGRAERRLDGALRELDRAGGHASRATRELPPFAFGALVGEHAPPMPGGDSERRKARRVAQRQNAALRASIRAMRSGRTSAFKATGRTSIRAWSGGAPPDPAFAPALEGGA